MEDIKLAIEFPEEAKDFNKPEILMLSGGRDSSACLVKLCEDGTPPDYAVFCNTLHEFPEMYEYLGWLGEYLKRRFDFEITVIEPGCTFEDWAFTPITKGERKGIIRGLPLLTVPCYWKREAKVYPFERWAKKMKIGDHTQIIGYTYSELQRAQVEATNQRYPLIEWGMREIDVAEFLKARSIDNKLYRHFNRTGCYFCPKQRVSDFYNVYKYHPEIWEKMKRYEKKALDMDALNSRFCKEGTALELEVQFKIRDKSGSFDFEYDDDLEFCFCAL